MANAINLKIEFPDHVSVVTGAAQGIGLAIAQAFARARCAVMLFDINADAATEAVEAIRAEGGMAEFVYCDLADGDSIHAAVATAAQELGRIDFVVNNARPYLPRARFPESMATWDDALAILLKAPALMCEAALPYLQSSKRASIINIGSTNAFTISGQALGYSVAKAGLLALTRSLAVELGNKGIRVNAICPGLVRIANRPQPSLEERRKRGLIDAVLPLHTITDAEQLGKQAVLLCSDCFASMTGQALIVDAGQSLLDQCEVGMRAQATPNNQQHHLQPAP